LFGCRLREKFPCLPCSTDRIRPGGASRPRSGANGLECDAVIHLHGGRYGLVEIKLGGKELVEKGASSLKKLSSKLDTSKMRKPSFLMVLTAVGDVAYRREDGVVVCPISALKP